MVCLTGKEQPFYGHRQEVTGCLEDDKSINEGATYDADL